MKERSRCVPMPLFMHELLVALQPGDSVLDLGCGKGSLTSARPWIERVEAGQINGARLQGKIQAFEAEYGDRLKRALALSPDEEG